MKIYKRLEMTLENIKFQKGQVYWDDIEKLEHILCLLHSGYHGREKFRFIDPELKDDIMFHLSWKAVKKIKKNDKKVEKRIDKRNKKH